jgi:hypothetical protein
MIVPYLSEDWKRTYDELVGEVGPWEDEGTSHEGVGYWSGSASPVTTEKLERMTQDDLFSCLRTWVPSGGYFEASRAGLGNALGALVRTKSELFSKITKPGRDPGSPGNISAQSKREHCQLAWPAGYTEHQRLS